MNVLFIAPYIPSRIRVRPYHFIRELSVRHSITLLAVGSESREAVAAADLRRVCRRVELVPLATSSMVRSLAAASLHAEPLQSAVCYSATLQRRLFHLLGEQVFDVIHVEHLRAARVRHDLPRSVPTVFDSVDSITLLLERTLRSSHSLRQRVLAALELHRTRQYEARLMRMFDAIIVTAPDDANKLRALAPGVEPWVIPNGVDFDEFRPAPHLADPRTIVFSGKMSYHANASAVLHFAHDILPLVRRRCPDVRVLVVGANPPPAVKALTRDPGFTVTGAVPSMRAALAQASLAICPVTVKVGIQNKILEAMAMGLPIVCSRLGGGGIAASPAQGLLVADDDAMFANLVCQLLEDPALRSRVGLAGRRFVETHHRWPSATDGLAAVYSKVVGSRLRNT